MFALSHLKVSVHRKDGDAGVFDQTLEICDCIHCTVDEQNFVHGLCIFPRLHPEVRHGLEKMLDVGTVKL